MSLTVSVQVPPSDRKELESWLRAPSIRAGLAQRARIVLLAADGLGTAEIVRRVGVSKPTVIAWKRRYAAEGLGGLADRHKAGKPRTTDDVAIVLRTLEPPPARLGVTHWLSRLLARELGLSNVKVSPPSGASTGCSRGGCRRSSSPPTPSSTPRSATSSGST